MSKYLHKKGLIKSNALAALIRDPLFKQRIEKNIKGKGSYSRKAKYGNKDYQRAGKSRFISLFFSAF